MSPAAYDEEPTNPSMMSEERECCRAVRGSLRRPVTGSWWAYDSVED